MPYIKQELRPIFDFAVHLAQKNAGTDWIVGCIEFGVKDMQPKVMDGCLNYGFTQLLRKLEDLVYAKIIIDLVLNKLFWMEPNYFKFERVKGLLGCMIDEYQRRAWRNQREVVKALKFLLSVNAYNTSVYEDEKIKQNGDLE